MGIGFNDYIHQVRLQKSMNGLMNSNKSILEVAINHGFPNAKSYTQVFKKTYGVTPHAFRKNNDTIVDNGHISDQNFSGDSINLLKDFIMIYNSQNISHDLPQVVSADIDLSKNKHDQINFNKIIYFDFVYDGLNSNWQNNLSKIQDELKFSYIKFRGIFTKGMYFYDVQDNWYNWFNVDNLLDFFISIGLKPFIELTYKPSEHTLNAWYEILESFLNHCVKRYGLEELKSWNFEIASEDRRYDSSIKLYTKTLKRLRVKFRDLRLGILFIPADDFEERDYLINFRDKDLKFMSVQLDEDIYHKKTELCHQLFYNIRVGMGLETYFMKINSNTEYNDTCARASKFIANTLQINKVGVQVPFIDNIRNKRIFNGSSGLVTYNGLKKPLYNAYYMMNKISGKLIDSDKNYVVVKNNDTYMILMYNYIEREFETSENLESFIDIYNARVQDNQKYKINLHLKLSAEEGNYELRRYHLSPKYGSIFDAWLRMGAPYNLRKGDMDIIKSKEKMDLNIRNQYVKNIIKIKETIEPDEVILYEVRKL